MSLSVNTIEGRRGSACNNNAFSIVADGKQLVDIIPADSVPGKSADDILSVFRAAATATSDPAQIKQAARRSLGLG